MKSTLFFIIFLYPFVGYTFDYITDMQAKRKVISTYPITLKKKILYFKLDGTFKDNLGNLGVVDTTNILILQNNNVINLEAYGKIQYQNGEIIYTKSLRNQQEQETGVGHTTYISASNSLVALIGVKCTYAAKYYEENIFLIQKCRLSEEQKKVLSTIKND